MSIPSSWPARFGIWAPNSQRLLPMPTPNDLVHPCRTGRPFLILQKPWPDWLSATNSSSCPMSLESFAGSNKRLGVTFTSIITAQDVGSYKPSPRNFDALAAEVERLGIGQGKLLHVAQSLFHDHVPAKSGGLPTVWINRRHDNPGWGATPKPPASVTPDWTFRSMAAFADAVDAEGV